MTHEIEVTKVDERAAQRLADATGRVVYMSNLGTGWVTWMTTDRDEAVAWGEFVAFPPRLAQRDLERVLERAHRGPSEQEVEAHRMGGNLGELARRALEEPQAEDHCFRVGKQILDQELARKRQLDELDPEPQLRVVRVLEYRGPQSWIEQTLGQSVVNPLEPYKTAWGKDGAGEIVEQIRTTERLCRWCGGEHLGACSEDGCSANPAVSRHRGGK